MNNTNSSLKSNSIVGFFEDEDLPNKFSEGIICVHNHFNLEQGCVSILNGFLTEGEASSLISSYRGSNVEPKKTGENGYVRSYDSNKKPSSMRKTLYSEKLANLLYMRLIGSLVNLSVEDVRWKPIGVNPAFRFIEYVNDGFLVPHYDFPYEKSKNVKTLKSLVLNLTESSAETVFLTEHRVDDLTDMNQEHNSDDVIMSIPSVINNSLLFDHKILHSGTRSSDKIILRTDIMYEKVLD